MDRNNDHRIPNPQRNNAKITTAMIPRIKSLEPMADYKMLVLFDDSRKVVYDVQDDIDTLPVFQALRTVHGLFNQVQLDESRTCVYWTDQIDLASDSIYEYGVTA